jgi:hypothetical protein
MNFSTMLTNSARDPCLRNQTLWFWFLDKRYEHLHSIILMGSGWCKWNNTVQSSELSNTAQKKVSSINWLMQSGVVCAPFRGLSRCIRWRCRWAKNRESVKALVFLRWPCINLAVGWRKIDPATLVSSFCSSAHKLHSSDPTDTSTISPSRKKKRHLQLLIHSPCKVRRYVSMPAVISAWKGTLLRLEKVETSLPLI